MLTDYLNAAMAHAEYEELPDSTWYAHIAGFPGLWASEPGRTATEAELRSALEDWLTLTLQSDERAPVVDGLDSLPRPTRIHRSACRGQTCFHGEGQREGEFTFVT